MTPPLPDRPEWKICANCLYACETRMSGEKLPTSRREDQVSGFVEVDIFVCRHNTAYFWTDVAGDNWCGQGWFINPSGGEQDPPARRFGRFGRTIV